MSKIPPLVNKWLSSFAVGERRYFETTYADSGRDMRIITSNVARRTDGLRVSCGLWSAVRAPEVRYLICVERII